MDTNTLLRIYQTYSLEKISALRSVLTRGQSPCAYAHTHQYLNDEPPTNSRMMLVGGISLSLTGMK